MSAPPALKSIATLVNRFLPLFHTPDQLPHQTRRKLVASAQKRLDDPDVLFLIGQSLELALFLLGGSQSKKGWMGLDPTLETEKAIDESLKEFAGDRKILRFEVEDEARPFWGLFDASSAARDLGLPPSAIEDLAGLRDNYRDWVNASQANLGVALGYPTAGDSHPSILQLGTKGRMTIHLNFRLSPGFISEFAAKSGFADPADGEVLDVPFVVNFACEESHLGERWGDVWKMYQAVSGWAVESGLGTTELYLENSGVVEARESKDDKKAIEEKK